MVRTRFAPSPTGNLHIGSLRTAAYAYALAKHSAGQFLLRIEDTDQKREIAGATTALQNTLHKFGLGWDGECVVQSARAASGAYKEAALSLMDTGRAFYCQCQARNAKTEGYSLILRDPCRDQGLTSGAVKLRVPDGESLSYHDFVLKKDVSWDSSKIPDTTLLKSDGLLPTYHLGMPVDDHLMAITHVIRGVEWLTSTPIHILVFRFLGYDLPQIGHPSAILDPDGGKLSKRKGNVAVEDFLATGYLPEALLNFVILLGWAPKDNRELFTLEQFVSDFDIHGFQKSNPVMNLQKLDWFNGHYIRQKSNTELTQLVKPYVKSNLSDTQITQILPLIKERLVKLSDFDTLTAFFSQPPVYQADLWPDPASATVHLTYAAAQFDSLSTENITDNIKNQGWKVGDFFMSLRIAVCGSRTTPPLTEVMHILGKEETLKRIDSAIDYLKN